MGIIISILIVIASLIVLAVVARELYWSELLVVGPALLSIALGTILVFATLILVRWSPSEKELTGYVYQRQESYGYATYNIRFSTMAGKDEQPSFCTIAGTEDDNKFKELVGTEKKAVVTVHKRSPSIADNPFECDAYATLKSVEGK